jgi:hypothetical protein
VTQVENDGLGFLATCSMLDGSHRSVQARWAEGTGATFSGGTLESSD